jgi:two-component system response regulator NreC
MLKNNCHCNARSVPMRVLLADDHVDVRSAIRLLLEQDSSVFIMDSVASCGELLVQAINGCPDLVLLDWELPGSPIEELVRALHVVCPHVTVIALSGRPEERQKALSSGARCFICKDEPPEQLIAALETIRFSRHYLVNGIGSNVVSDGGDEVPVVSAPAPKKSRKSRSVGS